MEYIAFIHKEDSDYVAVIPDLNFVSSYGETFVEVVHNIVEAGELYCEDLKTLPKPSTLEDLKNNYKDDLRADAMPQLLNIKVEKLKRINVMMRSDIIEVLPERLVEFNGNRSAYLQNLVIHDLQTHNIAL
ncbi:MAG: type II toxin-antitoxin system HicB family antitoxin [Helicobacteraceae bacterium]|nr:type II toxin-antitoxin system HicB family antitoxin [Helicobacteraceae bacterium]